MNRPLLVGIFIFIGIAILVTGIFIIGSQSKAFIKTKSLKVTFDNVQGLQSGNKIWLSGVKIGTVKKVALDDNRKVEVTLSIEKSSFHYIHKDSKVRIGSDGLIGNTIVIIYGGSLDSPLVSPDDFLQSEQALNMSDIQTTLQESNKNLLEITNNLKEVSRRLAKGEGTIGALLKDSSYAGNLQSALINLKAGTAAGAKALSNFMVFSSQLNNKNSSINELLSDTVVFRNLQQSISNFTTFSNQLNKPGTSINKLVTDTVVYNDLIQSMEHVKDATLVLLNRLNRNNNPIGVMLNDENSAENLKAILKNLKTSSEKLDADLEAVQHNFLLRGFFKKKNKNK